MWDLAGARCRFGKHLEVEVEVDGSVPPVADVLREFPSRRIATEHGELPQGLAVRLRVKRAPAPNSASVRRRASTPATPRSRALARGGERGAGEVG